MKKLDNKIYPPLYSGLNIDHADGVYIFDLKNNKKYLDFSAGAGMAIVGYNNIKIKNVILKQLDKLIISPQKYQTDEAAKLLQTILSCFTKTYDCVLPSVTGSEAVETAMQVAITHTGRNKFLSFSNSYHGRTLAAGSVGASYNGYNFCADKMDVVMAPKNHMQIEKCISQIEEKFQNEKYAAFIGETIITNAGYFVLLKVFIKKLHNICRKYGVLLIIDEILTGFGRTGRLFAFEHYDIEPDLVCIAKGLSSGYIPISGVVTRHELVQRIDYFSTFAWSPLACVVANENILIIRKGKLVENSKKLGNFALVTLNKLLKSSSLIKRINGKGLAIAIEIVNRESTLEVYERCLELGLIVFKNTNLNMLFIQPPLIIEKKDLVAGIKIFVQAVSSVKKKKYDKEH